LFNKRKAKPTGMRTGGIATTGQKAAVPEKNTDG